MLRILPHFVFVLQFMLMGRGEVASGFGWIHGLAVVVSISGAAVIIVCVSASKSDGSLLFLVRLV